MVQKTVEFRINKDSYDSTDWANKMAHTNGQLEALLELKSIIESALPK